MNSAEQQFSWAARISNFTLVLMSAGLLGFVGMLLQASHRTLGHLTWNDFWLMPLIAGSLWNMLAAEFDPAALRGAVEYWPLLVPLAGVAVLLAWKLRRRGTAVHTSRTGGEHGRQ